MTVGERGFVRQAVVMAGGTFLGQAVLALSSPLLSRLYDPAQFGVYAVFSAMLGMVVTVASLRYEAAIPLPSDDDDAKRVVGVSLVLVLVVGVVVGMALGPLAPSVAIWLGTPAFAAYWWLLPLGIVGIGAYQVLNMWGVRKERFAVLSGVKVWQTLLQTGLQVLGALLGLGDVGLFGGYVAGRGAGALLLVRRVRLRPFPAQWDWRRVVKRYRAFPTYYAPAALISSAGLELPAVFFARFFALDAAGYFSLTLRMLTLPIFLIGQATSQVFYPRAAALDSSPSETRRLVERVATTMVLIGLPLFAFVAMAGPQLFALVFGSEWRPAGVYARLLAPWFFASLVVTPVTSLVLVKERQRTALGITIIETAVRLGLLVIGGLMLTPEQTVGLYGAAGAVIATVYLNWVLRLAGTNLLAWLGTMQRYLVVASASVIMTAWLPLGGPAQSKVAVQFVSMLLLALVALYRLRRHGD